MIFSWKFNSQIWPKAFLGTPRGPWQYVVYHFSGHNFWQVAHSGGVCAGKRTELSFNVHLIFIALCLLLLRWKCAILFGRPCNSIQNPYILWGWIHSNFLGLSLMTASSVIFLLFFIVKMAYHLYAKEWKIFLLSEK